MPTIELWYIETTVNNHNAPVYVDIANDMRTLGNGVFSATVKLDNGKICDYVVAETDKYAESVIPKDDQISGRQM